MRPQRPILLLVVGAAIALVSPRPAAAQHPAPTTQPAAPLDINTATAQQLNTLPGFGPAYTRRVIAGRPYASKNQLFTRGILPEESYQRIAALIVAHHTTPPVPR